jgi:hypothetical protein
MNRHHINVLLGKDLCLFSDSPDDQPILVMFYSISIILIRKNPDNQEDADISIYFKKLIGPHYIFEEI